MNKQKKSRRSDDTEIRSKSQLISELELNKDQAHISNMHMLQELQVQQTELEMQNQELREAQQMLEETRDRYTRLYDFAPVGYLTLDESGRVLEINLTGATMLGIERANITGKPFASRLSNGDVHAFFHHLRQAFKSSVNVVTELRILNQDGESSYVRLESAPVLSQTPACLTVMTNITEQKRLALALQLTRMEQQTLLNEIPAFVFYKDMNLRYLAVSQLLADFLGRPVEDVLGKTDDELLPKKMAEAYQRNQLELLEKGTVQSGLENRLTGADGHLVYISTVLAPLYNPQGRPAGLVGVGIDVSKLKEAASLNQELMLQNRTLTQNLFSVQEEERRHLARELHDELGQWITAINAEAQAIGSMLEFKDKVEASAKAIRNSTSKMHLVIRDMLRQLRPALLDELGLADSLRELVNQWKKHHPGIASELILEGKLDGLGENINITIYRIVQEALSNVANYADADAVSVQLRRESDEASGLDTIWLRIEDNGKGFDQKQVKKGLGLLGMRERAIAAGGEFFLCNTPGLGVRIDVSLPPKYQIERRK